MRFTHYKQLDSMDCGPTCLRMEAKYYGKSYSTQYLRNNSFITREGVSMLGISEAAEQIGFRTRGYRLTWEQIRDEVPLPCIAHWNQRHFIVVYDIKRNGKHKKGEALVRVADPASVGCRFLIFEFDYFKTTMIVVGNEPFDLNKIGTQNNLYSICSQISCTYPNDLIYQFMILKTIRC